MYMLYIDTKWNLLFLVTRHESWLRKISELLRFLILSLNSVMVSLTRWLNTFSRDYRYVSRVLAVEKKLLKEEPDFGEGKRVGLAKMWQPSPQTLQVHRSRYICRLSVVVFSYMCLDKL